jgi:excisionase family DNA binding protein
MTRIHETLSGQRIEYDPDPKVAKFLARVEALEQDPKATEDDLIRLIYGQENPIMNKDLLPGRGAVTREVLDNPVYHVLTDLLFRKRLAETGTPVEKVAARYTVTVAEAAAELGVSEEAVRRLVRERKLASWKRDGLTYLDPKALSTLQRGAQRGPVASGTGVLHCVAGKADKAFLFVKAPGRDDEPIGTKGAEDVTIRKWRTIAVYTGGHGKSRLFELEHDPGANDVAPVAFHDWRVEGPFKVVRKVNNAAEARKAWEAFRAV